MDSHALMLGVSAEAMMDGFLMMVVGMAVVFGALILIMLMLYGMQWLSPREGGQAAPGRPVDSRPASPPVSTPVAVSSDAQGMTPEIIAVISAAVIAVVGSQARIRSIRLVRPNGGSAWADQGRSRQHQSHKMHRGKR